MWADHNRNFCAVKILLKMDYVETAERLSEASLNALHCRPAKSQQVFFVSQPPSTFRAWTVVSAAMGINLILGVLYLAWLSPGFRMLLILGSLAAAVAFMSAMPWDRHETGYFPASTHEHYSP